MIDNCNLRLFRFRHLLFVFEVILACKVIPWTLCTTLLDVLGMILGIVGLKTSWASKVYLICNSWRELLRTIRVRE